jgi:hypothetical protein
MTSTRTGPTANVLPRPNWFPITWALSIVSSALAEAAVFSVWFVQQAGITCFGIDGDAHGGTSNQISPNACVWGGSYALTTTITLNVLILITVLLAIFWRNTYSAWAQRILIFILVVAAIGVSLQAWGVLTGSAAS